MNLWARYVCTFMTTSGIVTVLGSLQFKITKDDEINNQIELIDGGEKLHIEIKICWCVWRIIVKLDKYWAWWWLLILILNWCWYFARRVLVALINVLTHSAIGGEPGKMFREIWRKKPLTCNPMDKNIGSCLVCSHNSRHTFSFKVVKFSSISKLIYICHIWDISQHTYRPKVTNWNNIVFTKKILFKETNLTLRQNHLPASWHSSMSVQLLLSDSNLRWFWFWIVYYLSLLLIYWIVYRTKSSNGLSWQCLCSLLTKN